MSQAVSDSGVGRQAVSVFKLETQYDSERIPGCAVTTKSEFDSTPGPARVPRQRPQPGPGPRGGGKGAHDDTVTTRNGPATGSGRPPGPAGASLTRTRKGHRETVTIRPSPGTVSASRGVTSPWHDSKLEMRG